MVRVPLGHRESLVSQQLLHLGETYPILNEPRCKGMPHENPPKDVHGAVLKHLLRSEGVTADTWDREAAGYEVKR